MSDYFARLEAAPERGGRAAAAPERRLDGKRPLEPGGAGGPVPARARATRDVCAPRRRRPSWRPRRSRAARHAAAGADRHGDSQGRGEPSARGRQPGGRRGGLSGHGPLAARGVPRLRREGPEDGTGIPACRRRLPGDRRARSARPAGGGRGAGYCAPLRTWGSARHRASADSSTARRRSMRCSCSAWRPTGRRRSSSPSMAENGSRSSRRRARRPYAATST